MTTPIYRGSVKDVTPPLRLAIGGQERIGVCFEYTDAYSVFDWGRMPDLLPRKGEALALLTADLFERLGRAETWREFSRTPGALSLRKANRFGAGFNEIGEELQARGLKTHFLGIVAEGCAVPISELPRPSRAIFVEQVSVVKPEMVSVQGRQLPDYSPTRAAAAPRLVPLEVVFRFSLPPGSSLVARVERDPEYLAGLGFGGLPAKEGARFEFPLLEPFTKLESTDRPVTLSEGLAISGLTGRQLQELFFKTAWLAGCLRWICANAGLELADGKFEWAVGASGEIFLVDAIGPDELRLLKNGVQLSKEFLRGYYRGTPWYATISKAKDDARAAGSPEWKKRVAEGPPLLPASERELATQLYLALTNAITGRRWFPDAWDLERVGRELGSRS